MEDSPQGCAGGWSVLVVVGPNPHPVIPSGSYSSCSVYNIYSIPRPPHYLGHQLLERLVCSNFKHGAGNSEPTDRVHEPSRFNRHGVLSGSRVNWRSRLWNLENSLGEVETSWPVVKSWLPAGLVENVIHLDKFIKTFNPEWLLIMECPPCHGICQQQFRGQEHRCHGWRRTPGLSFGTKDEHQRDPGLDQIKRSSSWFGSEKIYLKSWYTLCHGRSLWSSFSSWCNLLPQPSPPWWKS